MSAPGAAGLKIRFVDSGWSCPTCGAVVESREMSLPVQGASRAPVWILASRRCTAGCSLIGERFSDGMDSDRVDRSSK